MASSTRNPNSFSKVMAEGDDPKAPMRLAECHIALGDKETAAGAYEVALEIAGDKPEFVTERQHAQAVLDLLRK